ncbi:chemosensory receptor A [Elysia marginata]|uniref:Chemosensory receptor A n=1 Tax=Elysia marginata TaxID=1093978 RepID=A0AAV4H7E4_9GAST|nr:chemosensory receptor A [Elysia marginata]
MAAASSNNASSSVAAVAAAAEGAGSGQNITLGLWYLSGRYQFVTEETLTLYIFAAVIISESVSVIGVVTNTINIIVFVRLGLRETTTISMLSLAVSDLLLSTVGLWNNLLYLPDFPLPVRKDEIFIVTGSVFRQFMGRASALITTFITIERCLCVIVPLKVRDIITRKRTIIVIITIFAITVGPSMYVYGNYRIGWNFYPDVNKTLFGAPYIDIPINNIVDRIISTIFGTFLLQFSFVTTCICTTYLVIHLRRASQFRLSHSSAKTAFNESSKDGQEKSANSSSSKEDRVARTVVVIATVFIICFTSGCISWLFYVFFPGFTWYGLYGQLFQMIFTLNYMTEPINSSVNLFIYYSMATNYRSMLGQMLGIVKKD